MRNLAFLHKLIHPGFFHEQVRYILFMNNMLDKAIPLFPGTLPMARSYLAHRVNNEPRDGNRALVLIRQVAERLTTDSSETKRYISSLCNLTIEQLGYLPSPLSTRLRERFLGVNFEEHLHPAAVYMNHVSEIQAWGTPQATSPLFGSCYDLAARYGSKDMVGLYLQEDTIEHRRKALWAAAYHGRPDIVRFILEYLIDAKSGESRDYWATPDGQRAIENALLTPTPEIWDYLLGEDGKVRLILERGMRSVRAMAKLVLRRSCARGWIETVRYLIGRAKEMSLPKNDRYLHYAAFDGCTDIMQLLLEWQGCSSPEELKSLLSTAATRGHVKMVRILLDHAIQMTGSVPEDLISGLVVGAAKGGFGDVVELLLQHGGDANEDKGEIPAIAYAVLLEHSRMAQHLLDHGARLPKEAKRAECLERAKLKGVESMLELLGP